MRKVNLFVLLLSVVFTTVGAFGQTNAPVSRRPSPSSPPKSLNSTLFNGEKSGYIRVLDVWDGAAYGGQAAYEAKINTQGNDETVWFIACVKTLPDCAQLSLPGMYHATILDNNDKDAYPTDRGSGGVIASLRIENYDGTSLVYALYERY